MLRTVLLLVISGLALSLTSGPTSRPLNASDAPDAGGQAAKPSGDIITGVYGGTVTRTSPDSITIEGCGGLAGRGMAGPKGLVNGERRFIASRILQAGQYDDRASESYSYRLADVQVGDRVNIHFERINGTDVCTQISVARRPGGRVPPAPGEPADSAWKFHEYCNANQDLEEKGIPLPEKYDPARLLLLRPPVVPATPPKAPPRIPPVKD